ncbi:uncharacterized protein F4812DRAFT_353973 [Daldinia caldariorum]|uniref:uncharacterized protein n=1 Tax=Daldinia caldariorum TaxID=326644 RepID=UPI002008136C|nr:uncharacterized protein F4812DRAFT_353973 [Daldinia caldariorum]KAI1469000.1 hypothetical protein F4812DRAFT_353973 [Daldinia caldariorum]
MCFTVYIHHTTSEHDTRHLSIINPVTGHTVYSPWQRPYYTKCEHPHIVGPIHPGEHCKWHPGCCRLECRKWCWTKGCKVLAEYHHFVDKEKGEVNDTSFLQQYMGRSVDRLWIAGHFFKNGVELHMARHFIKESRRIIKESPNPLDVTRSIWLKERTSADEQLAIAGLGQFALLWNMNVGFGGLPPRPGFEPDPRRNGDIERLLGLRVVPVPDSEVVVDTNDIKWPYYVKLEQQYQAGIEPIPDIPVIVPSIVKGTRLESLVDPMPSAQFSGSHTLKTGSVGTRSNPGNLARKGGKTVHRAEAVVGHWPLTEARNAVKWYKVRWAEDSGDKETWENNHHISAELIHVYWQRLDADTPPQ